MGDFHKGLLGLAALTLVCSAVVAGGFAIGWWL